MYVPLYLCMCVFSLLHQNVYSMRVRKLPFIPIAINKYLLNHNKHPVIEAV